MCYEQLAPYFPISQHKLVGFLIILQGNSTVYLLLLKTSKACFLLIKCPEKPVLVTVALLGQLREAQRPVGYLQQAPELDAVSFRPCDPEDP